MLIACFLGTSFAADAFFIAQKIPNLFRSLFAEGAFNAAFTPIMAEKLEVSKKRANTFASQAFSGLFYFLVLFTILAEIFMPEFISLFAPGFRNDPERLSLAITLTRITFPFLVFVSLVSVMAGMLNASKRFAAAAATPILMNLVMITAMLIFVHHAPAYVLSYSIPAAGVIECLFIYFFVKRAKLSLRFLSPATIKRSKDFRIFLRKMVPGIIGAGIYQINLFVDTIFVSFLPAGAVSWMYYAAQLYHLPMALIGFSIGTALLPIMTRQIKSKDPKINKTASHAIELNLFLALPAMLGLFILAEPIISLLFQRGAFTADATFQTVRILRAYCVGLPAYVLTKTLANFFYARKDTKTPAVIAGIALATNISLNLCLMPFFSAMGIAFATSLSAYITLAIYLVLIHRRNYFHFSSNTLILIVKLLFISALLALYLYLFRDQKGVMFFVVVFGAVLLYFSLAFLFKAFRRSWL